MQRSFSYNFPRLGKQTIPTFSANLKGVSNINNAMSLRNEVE